MRIIMRNFGVAIVLGVASVSVPAMLSAKPTYTGLFGTVAAGGYDVTNYFTGKGAPKKGDAKYAVSYNGATYHFATKANADRFKATPAAFAPQYGGYCAWAMASGSKAPGDPAYYRVVGGKLYLNYNKSVQEKWSRDVPGFITKANVEWRKIS